MVCGSDCATATEPHRLHRRTGANRRFARLKLEFFNMSLELSSAVVLLIEKLNS